MARPPPVFPPYPPFPAFPPAAPFAPYPPYPPFPAPPATCCCPPPAAAAPTAPTAGGSGTPGGTPAPPPPGSPPAPPAAGLTGSRSPFPITSIPLAANSAGLHQGTGTHQKTLTVVDPASVAPAGQLQFTTANPTITTLLFELATASAPNWFAVAVPAGLTDFSRAHVFFHPIPAQGGYLDSEYSHKNDPSYVYSGTPWTNLFYLIERLGYQSAASVRPTVVVIPFLTSAATNTGIFAPNWSAILSDILTDARTAVGVPGTTPVDVAEMIVSSHSVGIVYAAAFRSAAPGLTAVLKDVWDFDGLASSSPGLSNGLVTTGTYRAVKYDQGGGVASFAVPGGRWGALPVPVAFPPYPNHSDVHHLIRDFMAVHAATLP